MSLMTILSYIFLCIVAVNIMISALVISGTTPKNSSAEEEEFINQMKENIKKTILKKLNLKKAPNSTYIKPVLQTLNFNGSWTQTSLFNQIESESLAIFSQIDNDRNVTEEGIRFTFRIPELQNASSFHLWMFKSNSVDSLSLIQRIAAPYGGFEIVQNISVTNQSQYNGWTRFEIFPLVQYALSQNHAVLDLQAVCIRDCTYAQVISDAKELKPFIIAYHHGARSSRTKRQIECSGTNDSCCRDGFYMSFASVGYSKWIVEPQGYDAYFCRGSCKNEMSLARTPYVGLLIQYINLNEDLANSMGISVKCTANRMSPITFIYSNETDIVIERNATGMVVETCDCA